MKSFAETSMFLGIGQARTGTGWLHQYCQQHPAILTTKIKSMHYFTRDDEKQSGAKQLQRIEKRMAKILERKPDQADVALRDLGTMYSCLFDQARTLNGEMPFVDFFKRRWQNEPVFGEVTPEYCSLDEAGFATIRETHPKVRLLFVVRNPVDHLLSNTSMKARGLSPAERNQALQEMVSSQSRRRGRKVVDCISALRKVFSDEEVSIQYFESLLTPTGIAGFCEWLGIPFVEPNLKERVNASDRSDLPEGLRDDLCHVCEMAFRNLVEAMPESPPDAWKRDLESL